jgi:NAD(P)-dependent dehydrogenase (short-subunit alcohol dehydrogenase family)
MDYGLTNQVVIVTGGATGIGKAIAKAFHDEGAIVVTNGRDESKLKQALADIGERAHGIQADLTKSEDAQALFDYALRFGPIEHLVNNIGIFESRDFFEFDDARWRDYFEFNIMTGVRMSRLVLRHMLDRNSGSIIFISSDAAVKAIPWMVPYSMTKAAQLGLARALAEMTKGTKVRVNTLMPGPTATESVREYFGQIAEQKGVTLEEVVTNYFKQEEPSSLLQTLIDPAYHGRAALALATNPAINGSVLRCEGGIVRSSY